MMKKVLNISRRVYAWYVNSEVFFLVNFKYMVIITPPHKRLSFSLGGTYCHYFSNMVILSIVFSF